MGYEMSVRTAAPAATKRAQMAAEALAITQRARREGRPLSKHESERVDSLMAMVGALPDSTLDDGGFASFGEFVQAVALSEMAPDPRLQALQKMGAGDRGGFAVPRLFAPGLRAVDPSEAVIRPRAHVIEPDPRAPDANVDVPLLDQGEGGFLGGMAVLRYKETNIPLTEVTFRKVTLTPSEIGAFLEVSDKLLRNWRTSSRDIERMFRWALTEQEEVDFLFGDGDGEPLGALHADNGGLIEVERQVAASVSFFDLVQMEKVFFGRRGVWLAGRDAHAMIQQIEDSEGKILWPPLGGARDAEGRPLVFGKPLILHDSMPLDGLALVDWTYYAIKDGFGPVVQVGMRDAIRNLSMVRLIAASDGRPLLTEPITTRAGATVSPFVMLEGSRPEGE